ncbi:MAG: hypothetical protein HY757_05905 [Nitrospirae bacterium]|nr:hypothetical protein [Nitrospirota bacterium]
MADINLLKKRLLILSFAAIVLIIGGCTTLLPSVKETTKTDLWDTFDDAKNAIEKIIPYETTDDELKKAGIDPEATPNFKILTHLDIIQRFMINPSIKKEDLDKGVQACIDAKAHCRSYEIRIRNITSKRYGNVLLDLFNFKRSTNESGWEFEALIVTVDGTVVHKLWGGRPIIEENRVVKNPLGPLQDPSSLVRDRSLGEVNKLTP